MSDVGSAPSVKTARFVVVDDQAVFAAGMESLLSVRFPGIAVRTAATVAGALAAVDEPAPVHVITIVLLDLMLGDGTGLEFLRATMGRSAAGSVRTIVLSGFRTQDKIDECKAHGAKGYVAKTDDPSFMLWAIQTVMAGGECFTPGQADRASDLQAAVARLSPQVRRVYDEIVKGKAGKDIAREMNIGYGTVKGYTRDLYLALNVSGRKDLLSQLLRA
jgi:DNA-binding NarL/FixJ family response regulator